MWPKPPAAMCWAASVSSASGRTVRRASQKASATAPSPAPPATVQISPCRLRICPWTFCSDSAAPMGNSDSATNVRNSRQKVQVRSMACRQARAIEDKERNSLVFVAGRRDFVNPPRFLPGPITRSSSQSLCTLHDSYFDRGVKYAMWGMDRPGRAGTVWRWSTKGLKKEFATGTRTNRWLSPEELGDEQPSMERDLPCPSERLPTPRRVASRCRAAPTVREP